MRRRDSYNCVVCGADIDQNFTNAQGVVRCYCRDCFNQSIGVMRVRKNKDKLFAYIEKELDAICFWLEYAKNRPPKHQILMDAVRLYFDTEYVRNERDTEEKHCTGCGRVQTTTKLCNSCATLYIRFKRYKQAGLYYVKERKNELEKRFDFITEVAKYSDLSIKDTLQCLMRSNFSVIYPSKQPQKTTSTTRKTG